MNKYTSDMPNQALKIKKALMGGVDTLPNLVNRNLTSGRLNMYKAALKLSASQNYAAVEVTSPITLLEQLETPSQIVYHFDLSIEKVLVTDLMGHQIMVKSMDATQEILIEKQIFPRGIFLITFEASNGNKITKKIIL